MIERATLNDSPDLPDHTAESVTPAVPNPALPSADTMRRGYSPVSAPRIPTFDQQLAGGENTVGDPFTFGGFLGRPQGYQR